MLVYYVDNSIHQIPSFIYIARQTGGKVLTDGADSYRMISEGFPDIDVELIRDREELVERAAELKPEAMVHPDYTYPIFAGKVNTKYVQTFHGTSDKRYNFSKRLIPYDLMLLAGEKMRDDMKKAGMLEKVDHRVVGYPKLDRVFSGELKTREARDEAREHFGFTDESKPVILYAPTWRDGHGHSSIGHFSRSLLEGIPDDVYLLIKLHPNTVVYDKKYYNLFKEHSQRENVRLIDFSPDVIPIMAASDILVTDISTVSHEYLAFRRPMVFLANPWRFMGFWANTWIWQCGDVVRKKGEVWDTILRRLDKPNEYGDIIEKVLRYVFYLPDGRAAERAKDAIYDYLRGAGQGA